MACFTVPVVEAVITTVVSKVVKKSELKKETEIQKVSVDHDNAPLENNASKIPFSTKLGWLSKLLWGGSALLAFEHVWHGEVVPWAPFLTAAENPDSFAEMLHEMSTVGVSMAVLVTLAWGGMCGVAHVIEKKKDTDTTKEEV